MLDSITISGFDQLIILAEAIWGLIKVAGGFIAIYVILVWLSKHS